MIYGGKTYDMVSLNKFHGLDFRSVCFLYIFSSLNLCTSQLFLLPLPTVPSITEHTIPNMELFFLLFLALGSLVIFTLTYASLGTRKTGHKNLPPGSFGWPIMGETVEFLFGKPDKFVFDRMKKYSPDIFKTRILGEDTAVICGPNGHKFLFSNEQKLFTAFRPHSMQKLFRSYKAAAGAPPQPATVEDRAKAARDEEAKVIRSPGFLKPEALVRYLGKMDSMTQQLIQIHWGGKDLVKAYPFTKSLTLTLACRFFLGTDDPERIARLVENFDDMTVGMHSITVNFPGTIFYKANKAATAIRKELRNVIAEKKAAISSGVSMGDILSHMIVATDPTGKHMPEAEIADKIMGLLTAGYSTVATAMTFFMKYVGERPDVYKKVFDGKSAEENMTDLRFHELSVVSNKQLHPENFFRK